MAALWTEFIRPSSILVPLCYELTGASGTTIQMSTFMNETVMLLAAALAAMCCADFAALSFKVGEIWSHFCVRGAKA